MRSSESQFEIQGSTQEVQTKAQEVKWLLYMGRICQTHNRFFTARNYFTRALAIATDIQHLTYTIESHEELANLYKLFGDYKRYREHISRIRDLLERNYD